MCPGLREQEKGEARSEQLKVGRLILFIALIEPFDADVEKDEPVLPLV